MTFELDSLFSRSTRRQRRWLACGRVEEAEEARELGLLPISFDISSFERISESCLTQDDSMQIAHCQIQRNINIRRQRLVQLCNASSDFESVAPASVSEAEPNGEMHVGSLQRIEPHGHSFK